VSRPWWEARIGQMVGKKYRYLGLYDTEEEAAVGPASYCAPCHRMTFNSFQEGSTCVGCRGEQSYGHLATFIGCHSTQVTTVQNVLDDVASNVCRARGGGGV
jgi:hypothetical protein